MERTAQRPAEGEVTHVDLDDRQAEQAWVVLVSIWSDRRANYVLYFRTCWNTRRRVV